MPVTINGTTGIAGVDGSASTPSVQGSDTNTGVFYPAADTVGVSTGGSERMRVDSSGNVGIGTNAPSSSGAGFPRVLDLSGSYPAYVLTSTTASKKYSIGVNSSPALVFYDETTNAERMRIDSSGNLLVGTTSGAWIGKLSVASDSSGAYYPLALNNTASGSTQYSVVDIYRAGTRTGTISNTNTATAYNTSSDYRLKENVQPMTTGLATIVALKPVTYDWIIDKSKGEGFIAHELQEVVPLAVTGEKDAVDENGNINPQGVDYSKIVVHLVAAVQELSAKVDAQAAEIAALKANAPA